MKKIVITGGLGFLGQHLVVQLRKAYPDAQIRILARSRRHFFLEDFEKDQRIEILYDISLNDYSSFAPYFQETDTVFHVAAMVSFWRKDRIRLYEANVNATRNVIEAGRTASVEKMIYISSTAALGYNNDEHNPADETFQFDWTEARNCFYMKTKHEAENLVKDATARGLPAVIANPSTFFGPGDERIFQLVKNLETGKVPAIMPGGFAALDVRDLALGLVKLAENGNIGEQYLLTNWNISYEEFFHTICNLLKVEPPKKIMSFKTVRFLSGIISMMEAISLKEPKLTYEVFAPGAKFRYYSIAKAQSDIGFDPQYTLSGTFIDVIKEYRQKAGR